MKFENISTDIQRLIYTFLPLNSLGRLRIISKKYNKIINSLYKEECEQNLYINGDILECFLLNGNQYYYQMVNFCPAVFKTNISLVDYKNYKLFLNPNTCHNIVKLFFLGKINNTFIIADFVQNLDPIIKQEQYKIINFLSINDDVANRFPLLKYIIMDYVDNISFRKITRNCKNLEILILNECDYNFDDFELLASSCKKLKCLEIDIKYLNQSFSNFNLETLKIRNESYYKYIYSSCMTLNLTTIKNFGIDVSLDHYILITLMIKKAIEENKINIQNNIEDFNDNEWLENIFNTNIEIIKTISFEFVFLYFHLDTFLSDTKITDLFLYCCKKIITIQFFFPDIQDDDDIDEYIIHREYIDDLLTKFNITFC